MRVISVKYMTIKYHYISKHLILNFCANYYTVIVTFVGFKITKNMGKNRENMGNTLIKIQK